MSEEWSAKPRMACPSCGTVLELTVRCGAKVVIDDRAVTSAATSAVPQRTAAEHDVLAAARRAGLLEPFRATTEFVKQDQVPKDMEGFFLTFLRGLTRRLIPAYAMEAFNTLFEHRPLEYYTAQGIGAVVIDGYIRLFVPNHEVLGTQLRGLNRNKGRGRLTIDDGAEKLQQWIHTRWGYVAGPGALYEQLRHRSFGEFARPNVSAAAPHRT